MDTKEKRIGLSDKENKESVCPESSDADHAVEQRTEKTEQTNLIVFDEKTGLYNKAAFCRNAESVFKSDPEQAYLLIRWDVDHFRTFNELFGMDMGDQVLAAIGQMYREQSNETVLAGHWHADCFYVIRKREGFDPQLFLSRLEQFLRTLYPEFEFVVRAGIYEVQNTGVRIASMCDYALLAQRWAKNSIQKHYAWYNDTMHKKILEEQRISNEAPAALKAGQFVLYFQPQYNYVEKKISGAEVLVRWNHPKLGLLPPSRFIPYFEKNGFISNLDEYVWRKACAFLQDMQKSGRQMIPISVNISRRDIYNTNLISTLLNMMEEYGIQQKQMHLEITESAYAEDPEQIICVVKELQKYGFCVEMDDFGSGYSSLNALKDVPVDILKLDMKFIQNSTKDERCDLIVKSVVDMAHGIGLPVIAEGVETVRQAEFLKEIGCRFMQGYLFAKPMPEDDFVKLLEKNNIGGEISVQKRVNDAVDFLGASMTLNGGGAGIIEYKDGECRLLRVNDKLLEIIHISYDEYAKKQGKLPSLLMPDEEKLFLDMLKDALESGGEKECMLSIADRKPACWIQIRVHAIPEQAQHGMLFLSVNDISENLRLLQNNEDSARTQELLRKALADANAAEQARTSFLSNISHEMRTPMNAILGLASLAESRADDPDYVRRAMVQIQASGKLLQQQINDVLDMSELQNETILLKNKATDLDELFRQLEVLFRQRCAEKGVEFEATLKDVKGETVLADSVRLQQVFFNLLENAVRYTPVGGKVILRVERTTGKGGAARILARVSDTGIGMSKEFCSHLFEPFTKERNTAETQINGIGLGLSIAKKIVDLMNGTIRVQSVQGKGSTFTVELLLPRETQAEEKEENNRLAGRRLLLVEDNPVNAEICRSLLKKQGADVVWAENGKIALEDFSDPKQGSFDAVLMDIRMPVMGGLDAARALRALPRTDAAKIPIISISAGVDSEDATAFRDVGITAHLPKPIQPADLYDTLVEQMNQEKRG